MCSMKALSLLIKSNYKVKVFAKKVKSQGHKVKFFCTKRKVLSHEIHMYNMKGISPSVQKLWPRLSFSGQTNRQTEGQTNRLIPIYPQTSLEGVYRSLTCTDTALEVW